MVKILSKYVRSCTPQRSCATTGIPCLASPEHSGRTALLPCRRGFHRYNSSVDSLSCPEIWVVQEGQQAIPAYVVTFY